MKKNDRILISLIVLLAAALGLISLFSLRKQGNTVTVSYDGKLTAIYSLDEEQQIELKNEDGENNTLVIQDGRASITDADCPDRLCVKQGSIQNAGETIVCLPHKLVISIEE
ncbi:MAG: NusG domain II-containing protein [Lachnospiraceae bacterium]